MRRRPSVVRFCVNAHSHYLLPLGSLAHNDFCGVSSSGEGTCTAITKLCEGLKGSAVTSLKCAAAPECSLSCQRPLTLLNTSLCCRALQSGRQPAQSQRRNRSRRGPKGQHYAAIAQVGRLALEPTPKCLLLCQRPLTRLLSHCSYPTPRSQSRRQRHQNRGRHCTGCHPQRDEDHQPQVRCPASKVFSAR